jgi:hypothetical protein
MEFTSHKAVNVFHILVVFPLIMSLIYKDYFGVNEDLVKNILRVLVLIGFLNHLYQLFFV